MNRRPQRFGIHPEVALVERHVPANEFSLLDAANVCGTPELQQLEQWRGACGCAETADVPDEKVVRARNAPKQLRLARDGVLIEHETGAEPWTSQHRFPFKIQIELPQPAPRQLAGARMSKVISKQLVE